MDLKGMSRVPRHRNRAPGAPEFGAWQPGRTLHRLPIHRNRGLEIVLVTRGELDWAVEGRVERVTAGSAFFTFPWERHGGVEEVQPANALFYVVFGLDRTYGRPAPSFGFHPRWALPGTLGGRIARCLLEARRRAWPASRMLVETFPRFVSALGQRDPLEMAAASGLGTFVLCELARMVGSGGGRSGANRDASSQRVRAFLKRVPDRCGEPWTLARMAAECGLGRTQFAALVKEQTGDTPLVHLNRLRIAQARELLMREPRRSITEVAMACGFGSSQYFATVCRTFLGVSPRALKAGARIR